MFEEGLSFLVSLLITKKGGEDNMAKDIYAYTGHKTPVAGQYRPSGGKGEYTLAKGDIVPPNNQSELQRFKLVDSSKRQK